MVKDLRQNPLRQYTAALLLVADLMSESANDAVPGQIDKPSQQALKLPLSSSRLCV